MDVLFEKENARLYMELDCGSKGRSYWCRKISSFSTPTLLISLTPHRARLMANYALNSSPGRPMICAISLHDFYKVGLCHFKHFLLNPDSNVYLYGANR